MIYVVIPFADRDTNDVLARIRDIDKGAYDSYAPRAYFLQFGGTAESLAKTLGFSTHTNKISGAVLEINDYYGFANRDLWEWLAAARKRDDG